MDSYIIHKKLIIIIIRKLNVFIKQIIRMYLLHGDVIKEVQGIML